MSHDASAPPDRVLSTLNADGSRRWLRPRLSPGRFLTARRLVAYALIAIFTVVPYLSIGGTPVLRLDILHRRFAILGHEFLPTDTVLMALLFIAIFFSIFLVTALFGRVWCGWTCPQTVYMEFVYRPIERLFEGGPGRKPIVKGPAGARKAAKYVAYLLISLFLAHTFLAYFVDPRQLLTWIGGSPTDHPVAFLVMAATTGFMLFDFCYFREQTCLVACPYGRLQAAMLDKHSLIITYDEKRGEPRGPIKRTRDLHLKVVAGESPGSGGDTEGGDCIDCTLCVQTCPTGIDIREGLQMECIGCAQCIDACNTVMDKINRPRGLIRYTSQAIMDGRARSIIRPRLFFYPAFLVVLAGVFLIFLGDRQTAEARLLPRQGASFYTLDSGEIANQTRVRLVNRSDAPATYTITLSGHDDARVIAEQASVTLQPGESVEHGFIIALPPEAFLNTGAFDIDLLISDARDFDKTLTYHLLGPASPPRTQESDEESPDE